MEGENNSDDDDDRVFENDDLPWIMVGIASGAEDDVYRTRAKGKSATSILNANVTKTYIRGNSSRSKVNPPRVVRGEVHDEDDDKYRVEDDEEEEYKDDEVEDLDEDINLNDELDLRDEDA
ncbi:uncharacterized protein [Euphorbia lathyris]|uniref:uncharacterized protein n=1 Tax=Euphorbia lathyris TaxID=212925 RepID=UPI003313E210